MTNGRLSIIFRPHRDHTQTPPPFIFQYFYQLKEKKSPRILF